VGKEPLKGRAKMKPENKLIFWMVVQTVVSVLRVQTYRRINVLVGATVKLNQLFQFADEEYMRAATEVDEAFHEQRQRYERSWKR
jgi:hypothetical protein